MTRKRNQIPDRLKNRRPILVTSVVASAFLTVSLAISATEIHRQTARESHPSDPHAAHKMMLRGENLRRSSASYRYQNLVVTDMAGGGSTLGEQVGDQQVVVLNFIFTTCTTICPVQTATLAQVQRQLGDQANNVTMISVSVDPEHDTPARLREYSAQFNTGPQWQFLTGSTSEMIKVQKAFKAYYGAKMNHRPLTFIKAPGDEKWLRLEGMASAADIISALLTTTGR